MCIRDRIEKTQKELQKSVENIDRKISFCYMEYRSGSTSQTQFLEIKKKLEEKKEQNQRLLRELSLKYASVDRLVDKQNQALCTVLKCQGGAVLNAELVQNCLLYTSRGRWKHRENNRRKEQMHKKMTRKTSKHV